VNYNLKYIINYPKLNNPPNFEGNKIRVGKKLKLKNRKHRPREKKIAKFFQFVAAY